MKIDTTKLAMELKFLFTTAKDFLAPDASKTFDVLQEKLDAFVRSNEQELPWGISISDPLKTRCKGLSGENLEGRLSFIWDLRKLSPGKPRYVELYDRASTVVSLHSLEEEGYNNSPLLKFTVDVACRDNAPGAPLHIQVKDFWKPGKSEIPIPRIPIYFYSPTDCLDFLLGELFQMEWVKQTIRHSSPNQSMKRFADLQHQRIKKILEAQLNVASTNSEGSILMRLKNWKLREFMDA